MRIKSSPSATAAHCLAMAAFVGLGGVLATQANAQSDTITLLTSPQAIDGFALFPQSISSTGLITGYYQAVSQTGTTQRTVVGDVAGGSYVIEDAGYQGGNLLPTDPNFFGNETGSWGFGINAGGTGTGVNFESASDMVVFNGYPIDGLTGGPNPGDQRPYDGVFGSAINNAGMIVGAAVQSINGNANGDIHALIYQNSAWTDLGLTEPLNTSAAYGLNANGNAVVGFQNATANFANSRSNFTGKVATVWTQSNGTWSSTSLGTLPGAQNVGTSGGAQSIALAVNDSGQVVGVSDNANGGDDATLWQPNGSGGYTAIDLNSVVSNKLSSTGTLANPVYQSSGILTFGLKDNPVINSLGTNLSSCAESINNLGQIVGFTYAGGAGRQAFLATVSGTTATMVTLNSLLPANLQQSNGGPWDLEEATSINDQGQIVGWGSYDDPNIGYETEGFEFTLSQTGAWSNASGGYWESAGDWTGGNIPNAPCATAIFSDAEGLTSAGTIVLNSSKTVGHITFNSVNSYSLSSPNGSSLIIDDTNDISGTSPTIIVAAGSHFINVPIVLATNNGSVGLTINTFPGATLTLSEPVSEVSGGNASAGALTTTGSGNLVITQTSAINVPLIVGNSTVNFAARDNFNEEGDNGILVRNVPSISFPTLVAPGTYYNVGEGSPSQVILALASSPSSRQVLVTSALNFTQFNVDQTNPTSIGWAGNIDLGNNDMIVRNGNLGIITAEAAEGYNLDISANQAPYPTHNWTGTGLDEGFQQDGIGVDNGKTIVSGILSAAAAADTTYLTALGVIQNVTPAGKALYSTFDTVAVTATDVLVKYTYYGDANLDGKVDGSDYSLIDNGYLNNLTGWGNGDFNYDGVIDGTDYTLIDNAYNTQSASLDPQATVLATTTAEIAVSETAAVPEPATLGLLGLAAVATLRELRRRPRTR